MMCDYVIPAMTYFYYSGVMNNRGRPRLTFQKWVDWVAGIPGDLKNYMGIFQKF